MKVTRLIIAAGLVPLLVYLCLQTDHARLKDMPTEDWRLILLILAAAASAVLGKRFLNQTCGLFLGGLGGAFATLHYFSLAYGGLVGVIVGAIVVAIPIVHIGFENDDASICGVNPWKSKWRRLDEPNIMVAHPSYPKQRHRMSVYELDGPRGPIKFAAGEFSNGVWGFYTPDA